MQEKLFEIRHRRCIKSHVVGSGNFKNVVTDLAVDYVIRVQGIGRGGVDVVITIGERRYVHVGAESDVFAEIERALQPLDAEHISRDGAADLLEVPVAAVDGLAGSVVRNGNTGTSERCKQVDEALANVASSNVAAVEQQFRVGA
jgi:hypothetical protein